MTSLNGSSISTEVTVQTDDEFKRLSREEMYIQNRCLKETLSVTLEIKRILETIFDDPEVQKSGVVEKYRHHSWKHFHKFKVYRKGFGDHLVKTIANLDSTRLTKCFNAECKLPDCNKTNEYIKMCPMNDNGPGSPSRMKKPANGLRLEDPKESDNTSNNTSQKQVVTSLSAEKEVASPIQEDVKESENTTNGEDDA